MAHKYPGYVLDKQMKIVNKSDTVIKLDQLLQLLLSKDFELYE